MPPKAKPRTKEVAPIKEAPALTDEEIQDAVDFINEKTNQTVYQGYTEIGNLRLHIGKRINCNCAVADKNHKGGNPEYRFPIPSAVALCVAFPNKSPKSIHRRDTEYSEDNSFFLAVRRRQGKNIRSCEAWVLSNRRLPSGIRFCIYATGVFWIKRKIPSVRSLW